MDVDILDCEFIGNLSHTFNTTFFEGRKESNCKLSVKGCKYLNNKRLEDPMLDCFAIEFGVSSTGGRFDAKIDDCLFAGNGGGVSSLCSSSGGGVRTYITNCTFVENNKLAILRNELDNPHKEKFWNVYNENFGVELFFE
jgi:hypothetical protein